MHGRVDEPLALRGIAGGAEPGPHILQPHQIPRLDISAELEIGLAIGITHRRQDIDVVLLVLGKDDGRRHLPEQRQLGLAEFEEHHRARRGPDIERPRQQAVEIAESAGGDQDALAVISLATRLDAHPAALLAYGRDHRLDMCCAATFHKRSLGPHKGARIDMAGLHGLVMTDQMRRKVELREPGLQLPRRKRLHLQHHRAGNFGSAVEIIGRRPRLRPRKQAACFGIEADAAALLDLPVPFDRARRKRRPQKISVEAARNARLVIMAGENAVVRAVILRLAGADQRHAVHALGQMPGGCGTHHAAADHDKPEIPAISCHGLPVRSPKILFRETVLTVS